MFVSNASRSPDQWQAAINRNRAVAQNSDLKGAIQVYRGMYFWPLEPSHPGNDINIETIAHCLAGTARWGANTCDSTGDPSPYTVAQHSVHVANIVQLNREKLVPKWDWAFSESPALLGLLHDAPEGLGFNDLTRPVKQIVEGYCEAEAKLMTRVEAAFRIPVDMAIREAVRRVDNMMVFLERDELMGPPVVPYRNEMDHPHLSIHDLVPDFYVWSPREAKIRFLEKFAEIRDSNGEYVPLNYANRGYTL